MSVFPHDQYVELTVHFRCNLKCEHCMIEGTMDWLKPESQEQFDQLVAYNTRTRRWTGLILTGSEVTLMRNLPDLARAARRGGFQHVRIQTHGMRLADHNYCEELIDAGIDQFFVSVCAADAATHDAITLVPGSFEKTLRGLNQLDTFPNVSILTNTVITQRSYQQLSAVVDRLSHLTRLVQMDFWNYWPMKETDEKNLIVSHLELIPYLKEAILKARLAGRHVEVKNVPECLLGTLGDALDNRQPQLFIDPAFWPEFHRNGFNQCVHRPVCGSQQCLGLNTAYITKFGWHEHELQPLAPTQLVGMHAAHS